MAKKPKKESPHKLRPDVAETAFRVMLEATGQAEKTMPPGDRSEEEKNPEAVKVGRKGGKLGGAARKESLSPRQIREIARKAAAMRWKKPGPS